MAEWYYTQGGQQQGPVSEQDIRGMFAQGRLQPQDLVWREGMANWLPMAQVPEFGGSPGAGQPHQQTIGANVGYYNPQPGGAPPPPNYLVQAILVTLCCCLPFGIVAIVYAAQVNGLAQSGNYAGAMAKSEDAKKWCWIGFICGLVANLLLFGAQILAVIGGASSGG